MRRDGAGVVGEFPLQRPDRRVLLVGAGRHYVHDRRQVEVELAALALPPGFGLRLQGIRRDQPLVQRGGDGRETGPLQLLNLPALLVCGHEEPDPRGVLGGRERLHGAGDGAGLGDPGVAGRPEQHRAEVIGPDGGGRGRVELVGGQSDEE